MLYYWLIFLLFLIVSLIERNKPTSKKDFWALLIPIAAFFVFFAFREGFTPDYYNYEMSFTNSSRTLDNDRHASEVLYLFIVENWSYRTALIVQTLLFCAGIFVVYRFFVPKRYWWLASFMFFFYTNFVLGNISGFRSCFVTIALLIAIIIKQNSVRGSLFATLVVLASATIHTSAIFLTPLVFLPAKPFSDKTYNTLKVVSIIVIVMSLFFANSINTIANSIFERFTSDTFEFYKKESIENVSKIGAFTLLRWVMSGYLLFMSLRFTKNDIPAVQSVCIKLTALFFMVGFLPGVMLIDRITYNLAFPAVIGVATIANNITNSNQKTLFVGFAVLYGIWEVYLMTQSQAVMLVHSFYRNILF